MSWQTEYKRLELQHIARIDQYSKKVDELYKEAIKQITLLSKSVKIDTEKPFSFKDYPVLNRKMEKVVKELSDNLTLLIAEGEEKEWLLNAKKNDLLVKSIMAGTVLNKKQLELFMQRNLEGLRAFQSRKVNGLGLSDRVWNYTKTFQSEMEMVFDIGIGEGRSADQLSRDVRKYLNEPDKLFRRVRDKHGVLHLSKAAENYHPGQGVYRSSYKNAKRLTRNEINMAYRMADYERVNQLPFVKGIKVVLSNNPGRVNDMCDDLKGVYPKDFLFTGWHVQCMCHTETVNCSIEELDRMTDDILNGETPTVNNPIKDTPANFKSWVGKNKDRFENWKSKPNFIEDNPHYF